MEFIYISREGDMDILREKVEVFKTYTNEELIEAYNQQSKCGITGVHSQGLFLMAIGHTFYKRFGKSPIIMRNNVLKLNRQIILSGDTFEFVK